MTRDEHLRWCKDRAIEYADTGDTSGALASMFSDLRKHKELENHPGIQLGAMLMFSGKLSTGVQVKQFIEGFN